MTVNSYQLTRPDIFGVWPCCSMLSKIYYSTQINSSHHSTCPLAVVVVLCPSEVVSGLLSLVLSWPELLFLVLSRNDWAMPHSGQLNRIRLIEDDLHRKTTLDGRRPLTEDDLWRKTTIDGRGPLTEEDLWRKTTFDGRRPLMEDDLWWKTTFDVRHPLM